jgi:hypothetical protein
MFTCKCGAPVQSFGARDGKLKFRCPLSKCKLFATSFVRPDGYPRPPLPRPDTLTSSATRPQDDHSVYFEACLLPNNVASSGGAGAALCSQQGTPMEESTGGLGLHVRTRSLSAALHSLLLDPVFGGMRLPNDEPGGVIVFRFPVSCKGDLLTALHAMTTPRVTVYDLPTFFCKCFESLELQYDRRMSCHLDDGAVSSNSTQNERDEITSIRKAMTDDSSGLFSQLKPYQRRGVEFIVEHGGRGMIADEMGLGKTVQAIAVAHLYRDEWPLLILCPVSLMENWAREIMRWLGISRARMVCLNGSKQRADLSVHSVVIVAYSSVKCVEGDPQYRVVIMDESHLIKSPDARRSIAAVEIGSKATRVVLLSGTPSMSRPAELYTQLSTIHPKEIPTKSQFDARYSGAYFDEYGYHNTSHSHLAELFVLLKHFAIRRKKKDVLEDLPAKTRSILYVNITAKEKKLMEASMKELRSSVAKAAASNGSGEATLGSAGRGPNAFEMKLSTAKAKIPAVKDYVVDLLEGTILPTEEKVILFAHHKEMLAALEEAVRSVRPKSPVDYIVIHGSTTIGAREALADHFRTEPKCHVAILSMLACGTGHNFTCASMVVFTELDWNPSTHLQCEDRVHRIGQSNECTIRYLLAEDTSDSVVWPLLQEKMTVTSAMLDNVGRDEKKEFGSAASEQQRRTDVPVEAKQATLDRFFTQRPKVSASPSPPTPPSGLEDDVVVEQRTPNASASSPPLATATSLRAHQPVATRTPAFGCPQSTTQLTVHQVGDASQIHPTTASAATTQGWSQRPVTTPPTVPTPPSTSSQPTLVPPKRTMLQLATQSTPLTTVLGAPMVSPRAVLSPHPRNSKRPRDDDDVVIIE